jgi:outer membrane protease
MFVIPYVGLMMAYHTESFDFGGYLAGSFFGVAEDKDYHVLRGLHFEEEFEAVPYIGAGLTAVWRMSEHWFLDVSCEYENIPETTGDMYIEELDSTAEDAAGISHESLMVKAALGVRL